MPGAHESYWGKIGYTDLEHTLYLVSEAALLGAIVLGAVALAVGVIVRRVQRRPLPDAIARFGLPLAILVPALYYGFARAMRAVIGALGAGSPAMLRLGVPASNGPLLVVPLVAAVLTVALVVLTVLAWVRRYWSLSERVLFTVVTAPAIAFTVLLASWGWLTALF